MRVTVPFREPWAVGIRAEYGGVEEKIGKPEVHGRVAGQQVPTERLAARICFIPQSEQPP
jgi:hypothetical protein